MKVIYRIDLHHASSDPGFGDLNYYEGLRFLRRNIDEKRNLKNAHLISTDKRSITVRVIPTDEELMIAKIVSTLTAD